MANNTSDFYPSYVRGYGIQASGVTVTSDALSAVNNLSGLSVTAIQLNYSTSFPASCAYAVSAGALSGVSATTEQINQLTYPVTFTPIGGIAIQAINKTGATSIYGTVLDAATGIDNAVSLSPASGQTPIGIMYSSSVASLATCLVVVAGKADILLATGIAASAGDWLGVSTVAGYVSAANSPPADSRHDYEVGHCIKATYAGGLTRGIIHFR